MQSGARYTSARPTGKAPGSSEHPKSLGERLSVFLVLAMEFCLVYALVLVQAGLGANSFEPLLPAWVIVSLFFIFYMISWYLSSFLTQGEGASLPLRQRVSLIRAVLGSSVLLSLLFCVWLRLYMLLYPIWNVSWLLALIADMQQFADALLVVGLAILIGSIAWLSYGVTTGNGDARILLRKGSIFLIILVAICWGEQFLGRNPAFWQACLLLPLFVWQGLLAQALQTVSIKRRVHVQGLQGHVQRQERIIFQSMFLLALLALLASLPMIMSPLGNRVSIPVLPDNILLTAHRAHMSDHPPAAPPLPPPTKGGGTSFSLAGPLGILLKILISGAIGFGVPALLTFLLKLWITLRNKRLQRRLDDEVSSLWNWSLFLAQLRALLLSPFACLRLFHRQARDNQVMYSGEEQLSLAEIRTIRAAYRTLLHEAAKHGYARQRAETPYEFCARLGSLEPQIEPELQVITNAYTVVRYGGKVPHQEEIAQVQNLWSRLAQKWNGAAL